jgi:2-hydroxychromene-2-carboxylate isomerase
MYVYMLYTQVEQGAFGSPTMIVSVPKEDGSSGGPMLFFGSDRFEQLAHAINKPYHGVQPNKATAKL